MRLSTSGAKRKPNIPAKSKTWNAKVEEAWYAAEHAPRNATGSGIHRMEGRGSRRAQANIRSAATTYARLDQVFAGSVTQAHCVASHHLRLGWPRAWLSSAHGHPDWSGSTSGQATVALNYRRTMAAAILLLVPVLAALAAAAFHGRIWLRARRFG